MSAWECGPLLFATGLQFLYVFPASFLKNPVYLKSQVAGKRNSVCAVFYSCDFFFFKLVSCFCRAGSGIGLLAADRTFNGCTAGCASAGDGPKMRACGRRAGW